MTGVDTAGPGTGASPTRAFQGLPARAGCCYGPAVLRICEQCGLLYLDGTEFCGVDGTATVETDQDPLLGRRLGQYEVLQRIGIGGVAAIYRARHVEVGHEVALKVLLGEMASRSTLAERFRREAHAACRIVHPNVVRTFDFGTSESGVVFLAMEILRGESLAERLTRVGPMPVAEVRGIAMQIADGLGAIHALGYVHRDIKPGNVLLCETPNGVVAKIIDFGLVGVEVGTEPVDRITRQGTVMGTPHYMSPEVIHGDPPTPSVDLYGLGATLYEMLHGNPPFNGTLTQILLQHVQDDPAPLKGAGDLGVLIADLLAKAPEDRPASAHAVMQRLLAPPRRRPLFGLGLGWVAGLLLTCVGAVALATWSGRRYEPVTAAPPVPVAGPGPSSPAPIVEAAVPPATVPQPERAPVDASAAAPEPAAVRPRPHRGRRKATRPPNRGPAVLEVRIESDPAGAQVSTEMGVLGLTPLSAFLPTSAASTLRIEKQGHAPRTVRWTAQDGTTMRVQLRSVPE